MATTAPAPAVKTGEKPAGDKARGFGKTGAQGAPGAKGKDGKGKPFGRKPDAKEWVPVTKLGRLVQARKITSLNEIFKFSIPVKEFEIIDILIL